MYNGAKVTSIRCPLVGRIRISGISFALYGNRLASFARYIHPKVSRIIDVESALYLHPTES